VSEATLFTEPNDSRKPILDGIDNAKQSIEIELYIFTDKDIFDALLNAKNRGVNVRVMLEENPYNSYGANKDMKDKLSHYGIDTKWSNRVYKYTHSKFLVIDKRTGYIMTLNLSKSAFTKNREFGAITSDPATVSELIKIFESDWARKPYNPLDSPLVVSPENSRSKISSLINSATYELLIYDEEIQCQAIEQLVEKKANQGVKVYVIVADPASVSFNKDIISEFKKYRINIKYVSSPFIHAKAVVVDNSKCFIGSVNLTDNSFDNNREVGIITTDPQIISSLRATFFSDFDKGS
jgi:phosphatidylserine/phosphatidylglycerophosphate/cardiolipin synthase-like enzyme